MKFLRCFNNMHYFNTPMLVILGLAIYIYSLKCKCDEHLTTSSYVNTRSIKSFKFPEELPKMDESPGNLEISSASGMDVIRNVSRLVNKGKSQIQRDQKTFLNFLKKDKKSNDEVAKEKIVTDFKYHPLTGSIKRLDIKCPPCQVYTTTGCQPYLFSFDGDFDETCVIYSSSSFKATAMPSQRLAIILIGCILF